MPDFPLNVTAGSGSLLQARTESATRSARASEQPEEKKLKKSASEFEAILLNQWLEDAQKAFATIPGTDEDKQSDPGSDNFRSIGLQGVATGMANAGGIGIASMLMKHMGRSADPASAPESAPKTESK